VCLLVGLLFFLFYRLYSENSFYFFLFLNLYLNVPLYLWRCWLNWLKCVREKIYNTNSLCLYFDVFVVYPLFVEIILLTFCSFSFFFFGFFATKEKKANEIMLTIRIKFLFSTSRKTVCIFKTNHRDYKTMINTESATKVFFCVMSFMIIQLLIQD
jgi:hypothetical protein